METEPYSVQVDGVNSSQWAEWFDSFADSNLYQTWSYGAVRWGEGNLSHLVLKQGGQPVAMAQLRIVKWNRPRCGIAYLRWGPLLHRKEGELDRDVVERMARALRDEYVDKRRLFLRIIPHAFEGTLRAEALRAAFALHGIKTVAGGSPQKTFVLDLDPPLEVVRKNLDQKWRNQLNRAEKNELTVEEVTRPEQVEAFAKIYDEMWSRKKFKGSTDIHEYWAMQESLPPSQRMRFILCTLEGEIMVGYIGTGLGQSGIYLVGATSHAGLKSKGSYLMQWTMIQWLKEKGIRYYDLGGINAVSNPGVYHFKRGLSGREETYLPHMVACRNFWSAAFAKLSDMASGSFRQCLNRLLRRDRTT